MPALGVAIRHIICVFYLFIYFSSQLCCHLRFRNSQQTHQWEYYLVFGNFPLLRLPSWDRSPSLPPLSLYLLYFVLPPFEDNGLPFWVLYVLCQHSEVVLWNLLSVQMFFQWICGGESGLIILFLHHIRTALTLLRIFYMRKFSVNLQYWPLVSWTEHICFLSCQDPLEYVILYDVITRWLFSSWG